MKERLRTIAKWAAYPLFYLFCLALFGYLAFPVDRLKDRIIAEFEHAQSKRGQPSGQRLEIDELSSYWFTGLEATGVRLILPPDDSASGKAGFEAALAKVGAPAEAPKESVIAVDEAHVRVRILPLLIGRVRIDFAVKAFGGEIEGVVPVGGSSGPVEVEMKSIDIGLIEPLVQLIGLPLKGTASGKLSLTAGEGKFNKANGSFELTIADAAVGDGKTKFKGQVALPQAKLGEVTITSEATNGVLKFTKLASTGPDVELVGDGKVSVREPWNDSTADLYIRFKFSDGYRDKNDDTRSLLGAPGSSMPALIEVIEPKVKRAKRSDGFYGFHVHGPLKKLKFDPSSTDTGGVKPSRGKPTDSPFAMPKKPGGAPLPLPAREDPPTPTPQPLPAREDPPTPTPTPMPTSTSTWNPETMPDPVKQFLPKPEGTTPDLAPPNNPMPEPSPAPPSPQDMPDR